MSALADLMLEVGLLLQFKFVLAGGMWGEVEDDVIDVVLEGVLLVVVGPVVLFVLLEGNEGEGLGTGVRLGVGGSVVHGSREDYIGMDKL